MPEHGNVTMKGQFLMPKSIIQHHPNRPKVHCNLICQPTKRETHLKPHESVLQKFFPKTEDLCDVTDTYSYMEPDVETTSQQLNPSPINSRISKYNLRHNSKPNCIDNYRY